ncbi:MAG: hypothetical protein ACN6I5_00995 [Hyphomicrobiales bacterium]
MIGLPDRCSAMARPSSKMTRAGAQVDLWGDPAWKASVVAIGNAPTDPVPASWN